MFSFSNVYSASFRSYVSSYAAYFQETFGIESEECKTLCQEAATLEIKEDAQVTSFLKKAIVHLAKNPCPELEKTLQDKFSKLSPATTIDILKKSVISLPYDGQSKRMIAVFNRLISFSSLKEFTEVQDVRSKAKTLSLFLPKPERQYEVISSSLPTKFYQRTLLFKLINYCVLGFVSRLQINLDYPPSNLSQIQDQFVFYRFLIYDAHALYSKAAPYFSTIWKANLAAVTTLILTVGVAYIGYNLYHKFHVGTPLLDEAHFTNLNAKAANGLVQRPIGREEEKQRIITSLSPPAGQAPNIVFLVGEPGSGKSQLVEGVALAIENGEAPQLTRKIVYSVNTTYFNFNSIKDSDKLEDLFYHLEGHEKNVILFFDEAQNGGTPNHSLLSVASSGTSLLEKLKTKLLEKQILCVFATTTKEYEQFIAPNKAFVDRVDIVKLLPLSDDQTIEVLQATASQEIPIDADGYQAIVKTSNKHPDYIDRVNPRKSLLIQQYVTNIVHSWTPTRIANELRAKQTTQKALVMLCREMDGKQVNWTLKEGVETVKKIGALNLEIADLEKKKAQQTQAYKGIRLLRKDLNEAWIERAEVVHRLSQEPPLDPEKQRIEKKSFFFLNLSKFHCFKKC